MQKLWAVEWISCPRLYTHSWSSVSLHTIMAWNDLLCADVPLNNYSLTNSVVEVIHCQYVSFLDYHGHPLNNSVQTGGQNVPVVCYSVKSYNWRHTWQRQQAAGCWQGWPTVDSNSRKRILSRHQELRLLEVKAFCSDCLRDQDLSNSERSRGAVEQTTVNNKQEAQNHTSVVTLTSTYRYCYYFQFQNARKNPNHVYLFKW